MRPRRLVALAFALPLATVGPAAAVAATLQPKLPDLTGIVKDPKWAVVLGRPCSGTSRSAATAWRARAATSTPAPTSG